MNRGDGGKLLFSGKRTMSDDIVREETQVCNDSGTYIQDTDTLSSLTTTSNSALILTRTLYHDRMQRLFGIVTTNGSSNTLSRHGYTLDAAGRRIHASRENGQRWDYDYDTVGEVTSAVKKFPGGTAIPGHSFAYQFDGIGNRASATHGGTGTAVSYTTSALNQYSNITTEGGRFILGEAPTGNGVFINGGTVAADRAGGLGFYWKQITADNSAGPLWSNDSVVSSGITITGNTWTPPNSVTPVHDDDGNLTYDGRWDSVWDAENRLTCMTTTEAAATAGVPRQRLDFVYDCQNRRVSKTVSTSTDGTTWTVSSSLRFLYDGWNMIAEYSAETETSTTLTLQAAHVWGIDLSGNPQGAGGVGGLLCSTLINDNSTTDNYYPAYDGNGNVSAWLDGTGTLLARMDYSPFGQLVAQYKYSSTAGSILSRLPFGFSTKYTDKETDLLYYGLRFYNPVTGGWASKDPIEEAGGENLYVLAENDPVGKFDLIGALPVEFFADGEPNGESNDYSFMIDGHEKYVVKPGRVGNNSTVKAAAYNHELRHIATAEASTHKNAIPYKQVFCLDKDGIRIKYYIKFIIKNNIGSLSKEKLKDGEQIGWEWGVGVWSTNFDRLKEEELKQTKIENFELLGRDENRNPIPIPGGAGKPKFKEVTQTDEIVRRRNYLTKVRPGEIAKKPTGINPRWTEFVKRYADEKKLAKDGSFSWTWVSPANLYKEIE